jgi:hypothetical protein
MLSGAGGEVECVDCDVGSVLMSSAQVEVRSQNRGRLGKTEFRSWLQMSQQLGRRTICLANNRDREFGLHGRILAEGRLVIIRSCLTVYHLHI